MCPVSESISSSERPRLLRWVKGLPSSGHSLRKLSREPVGTVCLFSYEGNKCAMTAQGQLWATCWPSRAISQGLRTRPWAIKEKHNERKQSCFCFHSYIGLWNVLCAWGAVVTAHLLLQSIHAIFSKSAIAVPPCNMQQLRATGGRAQINVNNGQTSL